MRQHGAFSAVLAQEEARMLRHDYVAPEHVLLGLIHEGEGVVLDERRRTHGRQTG